MTHLHTLKGIAMSLMIFFTLNSYSQTIYTYDLDESGGVGTVAAGVSATTLARVNGLLNFAACPDGFNSQHWSVEGDFNLADEAVQLTLTPDAGTTMTLTSIVTDLHRNNNGPQKMRVAYSLNGGITWTTGVEFSDVPTGSCFTSTTYTWNFADFSTSGIVIFRFYGWDASNVNGLGSVRHTVINGTTCTLQTWYADADGDGYGNAATSTMACSAPIGYVADNTDCDDAENTVYPGAPEICDGLDNDCDGDYDEGTATATISPADAAFTCKGDPLSFTANDCVGCTYQWFKNDNVILGATDISYATTKPAFYSVQVTTPGGCFAVSEHTLLTTQENPNANIYNPNGLNLCAPSPGTNILIKVGYTATNTYQWYRNESPYTGDGADSWKIYPTETGNYYCSITHQSGCNRITETRTVINSCRMSGELNEEIISVYPNPAANNFTIELLTSSIEQSGTIVILNAIGEIIYSSIAELNDGDLNENINLNDIPSGLYFVKVIAGDKEFTSNLVINK